MWGDVSNRVGRCVDFLVFDINSLHLTNGNNVFMYVALINCKGCLIFFKYFLMNYLSMYFFMSSCALVQSKGDV